ncbi:Nudix family hydrolase [Thauera sp.]|jgi:8-oxo-dGTP diphosphatase|uniref:Nudix family hydrolase n=1 Tax=Thauera sp. TaxID=1905334 RepID=UPI002A369708|nr:Nudix family hydrolase [Thauera sp.]MDX9885795.1 Nudix family hydrolase [Thauera sp.]
MTRKLVDVSAGVLLRPDGRYLLGQRAQDTVYAGYWEFPGGKVEPGETPAQALCRELEEELGIRVTHLRPWLRREHVYEHAHVRLHFFEVAAWEGELDDRVHSALAWVQPDGPTRAPMLPANGPILKALRLPRMMGITHASALGVDAQIAVLDQALARGLRLVQVREAELDSSERERLAREVQARMRAHRGLMLINGDLALARRLRADGVHLPAHMLMSAQARVDFEWVGASCHSRVELEHAAALGLDYALLGPVHPTLTHPGQPALGWQAFARLVEGLPMPVLALGGLVETDMAHARDAGAHGIAAIRGLWGQVQA